MGLLVSAIALAGLALAFELRSGRPGAGASEQHDLQVRLAVFGPSMAAVALVVIGMRSTVCA